MKKVLRAIDKVNIAVGWLGNAIVVALAVYMCANFILRKIFNFAFSGSFEVVQFMLVLIVFSSFCITNAEKRHVCLSLILIKMPTKLKFFLNTIICILETVTAVVIGYGMITQGAYAMKTSMASTTLGIPFFPFYYICGVFFIIFAVSLLADVIRSLLAMIGDEECQQYISQGWA